MKFIDEAEIEVHAGHGGAGSRHFRREKFAPMGGPDGGNGGAGGSVILVADRNVHTLLDFRFQPKWSAADGEAGAGSRKDGKAGQDLVIQVPIGTEVTRVGTDKPLCDLAVDGTRYVLAKGGRGGKGNTFFKSATNQAPEHCQPGEDGQSGKYKFSLKLVADVGLVGFPNAGKSTLISRISAARPKIADYPFTTLTPNLGVVQARNGRSFVVADIPGLIPGAHLGKGLGIKFLKHIERTRVLLHLIDPHQIDTEGNPITPLEAFNQINAEMDAFSNELSAKPQIVAFTKSDLNLECPGLAECIDHLNKINVPHLTISSASGNGIEKLIQVLSDLAHLPPPVVEPTYSEKWDE